MIVAVAFSPSRGSVAGSAVVISSPVGTWWTHARVWYADFLDFVKREGIFATMCTPAGYGRPGSRWDTWRICEFAEILAFYGLQYWYTWQVSVLGLGPIWMSRNEAVKRRADCLI